MCQLVQGSNNMWLSIFSLCVMAAFAVTSIDSKVQDDWWTHGVFYQIYPRSFMDSDGDGVGDLKGIISKLSYLAETGITATWLSPIFQSPMVDFGYDISNFATIHSEFGTMADFEQLIEEATRLDIKIFLDFVPNHSSDQCEWFLKSIDRVEGYEDFYVWADGKLNADNVLEPPNNWPSVFYGSAWTYNEKRKQYYLHQFTAEQPDLNFRNPKVIEAMNDVMIFWLNKGVAGFRVDAVNHLFEDTELRDEPLSGQTNDSKSYDYTKKIYTKNLPEVLGVLQRWRELLDDYTQKKGGPTRIMMSEAYTDVKTLMDYYENVDGLKSSHFPFNFLLITDLDKTSDARDFVFNIQKWLTYMPRGYVANWVLGNHDMSRVASRYGPERVDALNMLLMTLPGVAVTYNGDEIGMEDYRDISWEDTVDPPARNSNPIDYKNISRDPVRTPFQWDDTLNAGFSSAAKTWLPVHPNYKTLNLAQQKTDNFSHYKVYTHLVGLRKMPTLRYGRFSAEALSREVFAYKRELKGNPTVIVIINVSSAPQIVDLTAFGELSTEMQVLAVGSESVLEIGDTISTADLNLQPYEGLVCQY